MASLVQEDENVESGGRRPVDLAVGCPALTHQVGRYLARYLASVYSRPLCKRCFPTQRMVAALSPVDAVQVVPRFHGSMVPWC